ncbi:hypothetical protein Glove_37g161 [Diversispora epigaea]|uniref:Protein kinase domain-containing protein n=1 Tax=Diversispora epigaea TaxID=1348612 RepID=A0A397JMR2_9GLOM|nr:hypothetical protein Glove_37g161 [Diversispora epigaea]
MGREQYIMLGGLIDQLANGILKINGEVEAALKKFDNLMAIHLKTHILWKMVLQYASDIVHQDFHPGNLLSDNFNFDLRISDIGLSKLIGVNSNSPEKKNIFGVLPEALDARVTHRPTSRELYDEFRNWNSIKKAEEFLANQESTNTTTPHLVFIKHIHKQFILNFLKLPKPKNDENFERKLEELTESMSLEIL